MKYDCLYRIIINNLINKYRKKNFTKYLTNDFIYIYNYIHYEMVLSA